MELVFGSALPPICRAVVLEMEECGTETLRDEDWSGV